MKKNPLVAIIGAGPGGVTCALMLQKLGIRSLLIERATFPRFTIGESLLPISLDHFEKVGLLETVMDSGFVKKGGAVFHNGEHYSEVDFADTQNLGFPHAFSMGRESFDDILAKKAESMGIEIRWNTSLVGAKREEGEWLLSLESETQGSDLRADFVVDASGAAVIAKLTNQPLSEPQLPRKKSVFAHLKDPKRPGGFGEGATWILSNKETNNWGWLIPLPDQITSVGFVGEENIINTLGDTDKEIFENILTTFSAAADRFETISYTREPYSIMGYGQSLISPHGEAYCLIGNSIGFLDPIFSSGIAVATESAIRAAEGIAVHFSDENYDWKTDYSDPFLEGIRVFSDCVDAWYDGTLGALIHNRPSGINHKKHIVVTRINSLLAGNVWDKTNPLTEDTRWKLHFLNEANTNT